MQRQTPAAGEETSTEFRRNLLHSRLQNRTRRTCNLRCLPQTLRCTPLRGEEGSNNLALTAIAVVENTPRKAADLKKLFVIIARRLATSRGRVEQKPSEIIGVNGLALLEETRRDERINLATPNTTPLVRRTLRRTPYSESMKRRERIDPTRLL